MNKQLFFDDLWNNSNNTCILAMAGITNDLTNDLNNRDVFSNIANKPFQFFTNGQIQLSGSNQYEAPFENLFNTLKKYTSAFNLAASELDLLKGLKLPEIQVRTEIQTTMQWISSDRKSFTVPIFFTKWRQDQSTIDYIKRLERATSPVRSKNVTGDFIMSAPGSTDSQTGGLCALKIGNWFLADQLLLSNYSITVSQETDPMGEPLFFEGSITLTARKIFDSKTVSSWYVNPNEVII